MMAGNGALNGPFGQRAFGARAGGRWRFPGHRTDELDEQFWQFHVVQRIVGAQRPHASDDRSRPGHLIDEFFSGRKPPAIDKAQRYAERCTPLPAVDGETLEQRVDRLDRSLDYLTQCFQDEFKVRSEGNLLIDIIRGVAVRGAGNRGQLALCAAGGVEFAQYPAFERTAAYTYLGLLALCLLVLVTRAPVADCGR